MSPKAHSTAMITSTRERGNGQAIRRRSGLPSTLCTCSITTATGRPAYSSRLSWFSAKITCWPVGTVLSPIPRAGSQHIGDGWSVSMTHGKISGITLLLGIVILFLIGLCSGIPLPDSTDNIYIARAHKHTARTVQSGNRRLHVRDDPPKTTTSASAQPSATGKDPVPPSLKEQLRTLLNDKIGDGADERWVTASPIITTPFAGPDVVESNAALANFVRAPFPESFEDDDDEGVTINSRATTAGETWFDTYLDFLFEVGEQATKESFVEQNKIVSQWFKCTEKRSALEAKLVQAYDEAHKKDDDDEPSVGVDVKEKVDEDKARRAQPDEDAGSDKDKDKETDDDDGDKVADNVLTALKKLLPPSLEDKEKWAAAGKGAPDYTKKNYAAYNEAKDACEELRPEYQKLSLASYITAQAFYFDERTTSSPGEVGLSMLTGGEAGPMAQYAPAWNATIVDTTTLDDKAADTLKKNLKDASDSSDDGVKKRAVDPIKVATEPDKLLATQSKQVAVHDNDSDDEDEDDDDSLDDVPDVPGSLVLVKLEEGPKWMEYRDIYVNYARIHRKSVVAKYMNGRADKDGKTDDSDDDEGEDAEEGDDQDEDEGDTKGDGNEEADDDEGDSKDDAKRAIDADADEGTDHESVDSKETTHDRVSRDRTTTTKRCSCMNKKSKSEARPRTKVGFGPIGRHWTHAVLVALPRPKSDQLDVQLLGLVYEILPVLLTDVPDEEDVKLPSSELEE
ncbi:hypothetical protein BDZ89DRAFT_1037462 [Hymenopellis radicata]|nr:hypothetical protein BDZ89DRAFT_1037462 [Hymenopellis radicata]